MTLLDAMQATLRAEHAAIYSYGALGAQTSRETMPALFTAISDAYVQHRSRRDQLTRALLDLGAEPVESEAAYELPGGSGTPRPITGIARRALDLERSCATTYAFLVANSEGSRRRWAVTALTESAVRELAFRGTPEMFPGADEYADR